MRNIELDVHPETPEEKEIETYLTILHTSPEMKSFMDKMQNYAKSTTYLNIKQELKISIQQYEHIELIINLYLKYQITLDSPLL